MKENFTGIGRGVFAAGQYAEVLKGMGFGDIDAVFAFSAGRELKKANISGCRSRICFTLADGKTIVFMKRYNNVPYLQQIRNWIAHRRRVLTADYDRLVCPILAEAGIKTARVIAYGGEWSGVFERRSFVMTEKLAGAESLEKRLPQYFHNSSPVENVRQRREFIGRLADFAREFHATGLRHKDFYLAHIFADAGEQFYLIDLQRAVRPLFLGWRLRVKDMAALYYSAPGAVFSEADRLRFYKRYRGVSRLSRSDRIFIKLLKARVWRMADHDIRHGRDVPFAG